MKNYLILYLFLFSLFCHAQSSSKFYPDQALTEKSFNFNKATYMPQGFLGTHTKYIKKLCIRKLAIVFWPPTIDKQRGLTSLR